ncbi:hypothetical protein V1264_016991 [Littorina saxatilis]|uniref:Interferon-induced transmembrane protein n=1 Tax=Littorina saxatilis TaxID=31220 RepID=A0AAN9GE40_9CAEN
MEPKTGLPTYEASLGRPVNNGGYHHPGYNGQQNFVPMTIPQPAPTRPIVIAQPGDVQPETKCSLILSTLSAMFCFLWCGLMAIGVSWQARLQVLDGKFAHARHSLTVAKILNCTALFFGLIFWGLLIWYLNALFFAFRYR